MRLHPHRVQQLATEELHADDAVVRVVWEQLLQQEQVVRHPHLRIVLEDRGDVLQRPHQLNTRAAAALVRLQERGPAQHVHVRAQALTSLKVTE